GFLSWLLCMLNRIDLDDASPDAPNEHAVQMREDATSLDDRAAISDVVDHGETCTTIDIGDEAMLPCREDVGADPALSGLGRSVSGLISLEPLLEHTHETHRWQSHVRHGHRISSCLHKIVCFTPSVMSLLHTHGWVHTERHASLGGL